MVPASEHDVDLELGKDSVVVEGFLIALTLYSVAWFRVETRGADRVSVVPMAKQGFDCLVVDARLCPHCPERSVVLLETGVLCWFDMEGKRSGKVGACEGFDGGEWLGCEFGGQPWIVFVGCLLGVVAVDLRAKKGSEPNVLVSIDKEKKDRILTFCKSSFDDFHIVVVTEKQLLLFDIRHPLVPVLTWDHGLHCPCYMSMYRLSDLRLSEEFKWASNSGHVILVGSFWKNEFNFFYFGPKEGGALCRDPTLYAWELPFSLSLSDQHSDSGDSLLRDELPNDFKWEQKKDVLAGFWIVPNDLLKVESEHGGFVLIRLMLSGKLEMQRYHTSWQSITKKSNGNDKKIPKLKDSVVYSTEQKCKGKSYVRYYPLKIGHLWEYMNGFLSSVMAMHKPQLRHFSRKIPSDHLEQFKGIKSECSSSATSTIINDATVPTNIFEITLRRLLNDLESDLLPLAFSKYPLLFGNNRKTTLTLLEVPKCLPHHSSIPFFVGRINEKWSKIVSQTLVGPVFPVPFLLLLQRLDHESVSFCLNEEPHDDLLKQQCQTTLENVYPEISLADTGNFSEFSSSQGPETKNCFFVYEKSVVSNSDKSACKGLRRMAGCAVEEELPQNEDICMEPETASEDEKFTTFICGISDKAYSSSSGIEATGLEMFDQLNPYRLDFDSPSMVFQPKEKEMYKRLTRQSCKWLRNYKPHQDFCISSNIPTPPH